MCLRLELCHNSKQKELIYNELKQKNINYEWKKKKKQTKTIGVAP